MKKVLAALAVLCALGCSGNVKPSRSAASTANQTIK